MKIKESAKIVLLTALLAAPFATTQASDFFGGGNNGEWKMGPNGAYWDESDWPVWTPMYWMEEMMDSFDNDNNASGGNNRFGNMPFGNMMPFNNKTPNFGGNNMPFSMPYATPVVPVMPMRPAIPQSATTPK